MLKSTGEMNPWAVGWRLVAAEMEVSDLDTRNGMLQGCAPAWCRASPEGGTEGGGGGGAVLLANRESQ